MDKPKIYYIINPYTQENYKCYDATEIDAWIEQEMMKKVAQDEYDTMIILQVEYNKMTGETLEQDVAFEIAQAICSGELIKGE